MNGKFTVLPARVFEFSDGNLVSFLISFERSVYKKMYFIIQLAYILCSIKEKHKITIKKYISFFVYLEFHGIWSSP